MRRLLLTLATGIVSSLLAGGSARAAFIVVPNGLANVEGNSNNNFPFGFQTGMRYQQVYAASELLAAGTKLITQIAFRPDQQSGVVFSTTIPSVRIDLSTTTAGPNTLNNIFVNNVGANNTTVFGTATGSQLPLSSSNTGGPPHNFDIVINLTTPFLYDPVAGNLLLDIRVFTGVSSSLISAFDTEFTMADPVSRLYATAGVTATSGVADTRGLVTRFTLVDTPEPNLALAPLAAAVTALARQRRRVRSNAC